jgi:hypothetical protein
LILHNSALIPPAELSLSEDLGTTPSFILAEYGQEGFSGVVMRA